MNLTKTKQLLERIISIHQEIDTLNEELKDIKTVVDEELPEVKWNNLNKVAKLKSFLGLEEAVNS